MTLNIIHKRVSGPNPEVAVRSPTDAEVYGFKLIQLILPRPDHRLQSLGTVTQRYESSYPLVNENRTSGLGAIGATGFILLILFMLAKLAGGKVDPRLSFLGMLIIVLFFFGTIGGLGSIFSASISSSIRGWNRISVFIAFGSIAAFFLTLQILIKHYSSGIMTKIMTITCAVILGGIGLYDQTAPACLPCKEQTKSNFFADRVFVQKTEHMMPRGSAIFQLPYLPFPEVAPLHKLQAYDLAIGFLHSRDLH